SAVILLSIALLFPLIGYLPRVALSATIMVIAIQHIDRWTVHAFRRVASGSTPYRRHLMLELVVVVVVAVLSVIVDIVAAVFIGVAIAVLLFAVRMSRSIVRRSYRGSAVRSRKSRTVQEMTVLETMGGGILIVELQGALFFGTAETLAGEIAVQMQQRTHQVILDLRRVTEIDSTGAELLRRIDADLSARGATFAVCVLQPSEPAAVLADAGVLDGITPERVFGHVDGALEWAEEQMLGAQVGDSAANQDTPLARAGIFAGLTPKEMATVERHLRRTEIDKGRTIFAQGESGSALFIITSGTASAYLHQDR